MLPQERGKTTPGRRDKYRQIMYLGSPANQICSSNVKIFLKVCLPSQLISIFTGLQIRAELQVVHKLRLNAAMSGLVKAKRYDWKDSNLALFGSDLEKNVRGSNEFS